MLIDFTPPPAELTASPSVQVFILNRTVTAPGKFQISMESDGSGPTTATPGTGTVNPGQAPPVLLGPVEPLTPPGFTSPNDLRQTLPIIPVPQDQPKPINTDPTENLGRAPVTTPSSQIAPFY